MFVFITFETQKIQTMKKLIFPLITVLLMAACSSKDKNELKIEGQIKGETLSEVYLQKNDEGKFQILDTAKVENGRFTFTGKLDAPEVYYIGLGDNRFVSFFAEPAHINIRFHTDSVQFPTVSGSQSDATFRQYLSMLDNQRKKEIEYYSAYNEATRANDSTRLKDLNEKIEAFEKSQKEEIVEFARNHPESYVTPYVIMRHSYMMNIDEAQDSPFCL
ncbi:DUF4369 domain-containing protein [Lentimicrobium sp.]